MRFIRFVISHRHLESGTYDGTFRLAYRLRGSSVATSADRTVLADALNWFEGNLGTPALDRTASKSYYRRSTRGVSWFKDTAVDHLARMHEIRGVLERYGHQVQMLTEVRVGNVVYEDEYQVVAEPVAETRGADAARLRPGPTTGPAEAGHHARRNRRKGSVSCPPCCLVR